MKPAQKRAVVEYFRVGFPVSERRACQVARVPRSSWRYRSQARDQAALRLRLRDLAAARVRYGYRRLPVLWPRAGWRVNHKRVYRLYRQEGLALRPRRRPKRVSAPRLPLPPARRPHERWSMDFMADRLADGRRFRVLPIGDNGSRMSPAIAGDFTLPGARVVAVLERLKRLHGVPAAIRVDNGPEFISRVLDDWAHRNGVRLECSRPGKPTDNPDIESFNGHFREECLAQHGFAGIDEARRTIEAYRVEDNTRRPHSALNNRAPAEFSSNWPWVPAAVV